MRVFIWVECFTALSVQTSALRNSDREGRKCGKACHKLRRWRT